MLPKFSDQQLLITALSHRSSLNEREQSGTTATESNERLEFLGDAVLELATTNFLYQQRPSDPEGKLTAYRSALVRTETLAEMAKELGLAEKMYLSKGEEAGGGRENPGLLADLMEAVIGAMYLDLGFEVVATFLGEHLFTKFNEILSKKKYKDKKSLLQEKAQAKGHSTPVYQVIREEGPDHDKQFTVDVLVDDQVWGTGIGHSKQTAQQAAALKALTKV